MIKIFYSRAMAFLFFGFAMTSGWAADLHVAPSGDDSNPGTRELPLASFTAAQRAARNLAGHEPVTVWFAVGTYYLQNTIRFEAVDSGSAKFPVVYTADRGAMPVISGGERLKLSWTPYKNGIFMAKVQGPQMDQFFVNGQLQILARYPNFDAAQPIFSGYAKDAISPERVRRWSNPAGGFIHAMHAKLWGSFDYEITGKSADGKITVQGGWQNNRPAAMHESYRYVENIFEELDAPGEWFHDAKAGLLYYFPPKGVDLTKAIFETARLPRLIEFDGDELHPVKNIQLKGFKFHHSARTFMQTKEPLLRAALRDKTGKGHGFRAR